MTEIVVALIGLCGVALSVWLSNRDIKRELKGLHTESQAQHLAILRLTVMNSEMPVSERIAAGQEYVKRGGNGDVKQYYNQMLKEHTK